MIIMDPIIVMIQDLSKLDTKKYSYFKLANKFGKNKYIIIKK